MCGIVGYTGAHDSARLILEALRHLEYRGYDSAGIAVITPDGRLEIRKAVGKLERLASMLNGTAPPGFTGIGHTRWATHGRPSDENAHPHTDCSGRVCVVHNGVVENYEELRHELQAAGHRLASETDTEVIAHLIEDELGGARASAGSRDGHESALLEATRRALARVRGLYAIAAASLDEPDLVVGARNRAPLIVGLSPDGNFVASDVPAVLDYTRDVLRLREGELVAVRPGAVTVIDRHGTVVLREPESLTLDRSAAEKGGYPHFFLKEVHEQPEAIERTLAGRLDGGRVRLPEMDAIDASRVRRVILTGCGSAYHACMMARYAFEPWLRIPIDVEIASELRYRDPTIDEDVLCIGVSQSGETADTLAAFELAGERGAQRIAITNVVGSAITTLAESVLYQHSGPEVAVVASKSVTGQLVTLSLLGTCLAHRLGRLSPEDMRANVETLGSLPALVERALSTAAEASRIAEQHATVDKLLFLGRGVGYPTALEGALKLKEISYIQAEGYPAGELKHGPLALVEAGSLVMVLATQSATLEKVLSNIEEVRARGGHIIAIASEGDDRVAAHADELIHVPATPELFSPVVNVIPMQLFAYYAAIARGCDVDKPRNLAKSVTVE
ncbi:MAG TPA: glutamine--fructose-6-phosphate transaminase (isomerizing) [Chloroflexota bacterium]|nr:glutamine--fructose-6-phosphate transaminase (isomerizing) [Chloroflexota bacterium]